MAATTIESAVQPEAIEPEVKIAAASPEVAVAEVAVFTTPESDDLVDSTPIPSAAPTIEPEPVVAVDISKALETSGLVMVETSGDKVKSWQPEVVTNEIVPRRKRPVAVKLPDEPLVMVETSRSE